MRPPSRLATTSSWPSVVIPMARGSLPEALTLPVIFSVERSSTETSPFWFVT